MRIASRLDQEKHFSRRLAPGQPVERGVLLGREAHRHARGQREAEDMLGVVRHAGREAVAPAGIDLEGVGDIPAHAACPAQRRCPVSSRTSRAAAASSGSSGRSSEPVTDCQNPARAARSSSSTSSAAVCTTTRTETGSLSSCLAEQVGSAQRARPGSTNTAKNGLPLPGPEFGARAQHVDQHAEIVAPRPPCEVAEHGRQPRARTVGEAVLQRVPVARRTSRGTPAPAAMRSQQLVLRRRRPSATILRGGAACTASSTSCVARHAVDTRARRHPAAVPAACPSVADPPKGAVVIAV